MEEDDTEIVSNIETYVPGLRLNSSHAEFKKPLLISIESPNGLHTRNMSKLSDLSDLPPI